MLNAAVRVDTEQEGVGSKARRKRRGMRSGGAAGGPMRAKASTVANDHDAQQGAAENIARIRAKTAAHSKRTEARSKARREAQVVDAARLASVDSDSKRRRDERRELAMDAHARSDPRRGSRGPSVFPPQPSAVVYSQRGASGEGRSKATRRRRQPSTATNAKRAAQPTGGVTAIYASPDRCLRGAGEEEKGVFDELQQRLLQQKIQREEEALRLKICERQLQLHRMQLQREQAPASPASSSSPSSSVSASASNQSGLRRRRGGGAAATRRPQKALLAAHVDGGSAAEAEAEEKAHRIAAADARRRAASRDTFAARVAGDAQAGDAQHHLVREGDAAAEEDEDDSDDALLGYMFRSLGLVGTAHPLEAAEHAAQRTETTAPAIVRGGSARRSSAVPTVGGNEARAPPPPAPNAERTAAFGAAEEADDDLLCIVCIDAEKSYLFIPCGHRCVCLACSLAVMGTTSLCPLCRVAATGTLRVWN